MSGIFNTFNIAKRGMFAQQNAVNTTSHNIANANTEGYSRQRVHMETTPAFLKPGVGILGTGVDIASVDRIRDAYLDTQVRQENSILGQNRARQEVLQQVEMIFIETKETGLATVMDKMWDGWQELSKSPENSNARTIVSEAAQSFTETLNHMYRQLDTLKKDSINLTEKKVLDVHSTIDQIDSLNKQIYKIVIKGETPNDLMDKRDLLLDQLSELVDLSTREDKFGRISISSGDQLLLANGDSLGEGKQLSVVRGLEHNEDGSVTFTLVRGGDSLNGITTFTIAQEDLDDYSFLKEGSIVYNEKTWDGQDYTSLAPLELKEGELAGYQSISEELNLYQDQLNGLARAIAHGVNTLHTDDGDLPTAFFVGQGESTDLKSITAGNIKVSQLVIADARNINTKASPGMPDGDGSRALAIAQLRYARIPVHEFTDQPDQAASSLVYDKDAMAFEDVAGGSTIDSHYKDIIAKIGISAQQAGRMVENQEALTSQLLHRRYSVSGVSIDEEVANMIQFQHAYQANASVISTLNMMLDTLINRLGV